MPDWPQLSIKKSNSFDIAGLECIRIESSYFREFVNGCLVLMERIIESWSIRFRLHFNGRGVLLALAFLMCAFSGDVLAQAVVNSRLREDPARQVHWAMGAFFGTGWYQVDDNRNMYIFRIPPRQTLRESSIDEKGKRKLGIEIHVSAYLWTARSGRNTRFY